jgi:predicted thioesterase
MPILLGFVNDTGAHAIKERFWRNRGYIVVDNSRFHQVPTPPGSGFARTGALRTNEGKRIVSLGPR